MILCLPTFLGHTSTIIASTISDLALAYFPSFQTLAVTNSNQSRYESRTKWATTCTIGSSRYKNLKLRKKRGSGPKAHRKRQEAK
jgi:hypothetical protein